MGWISKTWIRAMCELGADRAERKSNACVVCKARTERIARVAGTRRTALVWIISAMLLTLLVPELGNAREPQLFDTSITQGRTAAGFPYMNGGLISVEQQAMERKSRRYNLKLVVASPLRRFISPVLLLIGNNQSGRIEKILLHAPWFYIQLPTGAYTIVARIEKRLVLIRDVYLRAEGRATYFVR